MLKIVLSSIAVTSLSVLLLGCTGIGQLSIREERNEYNDVVADTNNEQLLQNIVRAKNFERPTFFDLTEVDQTKSVSGNLQGGSSNIGAALGIGSLTSTVTLTDSPILKYQLPSSAGYIAQVLNPIPLTSLANLYNSNANITPLLDLSINRLTSSYVDYDRAIDLIDTLDTFGAINLQPTSDGRLALVLSDRGVLTPRAARLSNDDTLRCLSRRKAEESVRVLWANLTRLLRPSDQATILLQSPTAKSNGPVVLTRSALGSLRLAETGEVTFLDKDSADALIARNKNARCFNGEFYYLGDQVSGLSIETEWEDRYAQVYADDADRSVSERERALAHNRVFVVVERSAQRPADAYVAVRRGNVWYSIDEGDTVSKMNFALLGNLILIQAQAPSAPPTPTVISAAGSR